MWIFFINFAAQINREGITTHIILITNRAMRIVVYL